MYRSFDLICFSHLRWDFVYQRPQHLMSRFGGTGKVFFIEEPVFEERDENIIDVSDRGNNIFVCTPRLAAGNGLSDASMASLVRSTIEPLTSGSYILWFYTPMMLDWASELRPRAVVYDCMDELKNFKNAPAELHDRERRLFERADVVFTGGQSLFEAKREQHRNVHAFPSSIESEHFRKALDASPDPGQAEIPHPRIGFVGVIDERMDIALLGEIARLRPDWHYVMVGPVVKIDQNDLPQMPNIHYLGQRAYGDLPALMGSWDAAIMPFAINESTKYISPTKTPEYLAAGLPVVSTPITDVIRPYRDLGLVHIAATPGKFVEAIEAALHEDREKRLAGVSEFLAGHSWDMTFEAMRELIEKAAFSASAA